MKDAPHDAVGKTLKEGETEESGLAGTELSGG